MPPPDARLLYEAALQHLARYASTAAGLTRVLDRRICRWATEAGPDAASAVAEARLTARAVVSRLVDTGVVNDVDFATVRAKRLANAGRSRRGITAHLTAHGLDTETIRAVLCEAGQDEFASALIYSRRRRIGPFRRALASEDTLRRELAILARAGFSQNVAGRVLRTSADEAQQIVARMRR